MRFDKAAGVVKLHIPHMTTEPTISNHLHPDLFIPVKSHPPPEHPEKAYQRGALNIIIHPNHSLGASLAGERG